MKRLFDFVAAGLGLTLLAPLLACTALFVKVSSPGPVLFVQMRIGKNGIPFKCFKFRSMVANASMIGHTVTTLFDSRVVPAGRVLRSFKLDELPQLWNVLCGDMSLVGPRPEVPEIVHFYTHQMMRVLDVRPGITSIASLHLRNEESILSTVEEVNEVYIRVVVPFKVAIGIDYIKQDSLFFELKVLADTIWQLLFRRNSTSKEQPWITDMKTEISKLCARRREGSRETIEQSWKMLPQYIQRIIFNEEPRLSADN